MSEINVKSYVSALSVLAIGLFASWIYWHGVLTIDAPTLVATLVLMILFCLVRVFPIQVADKWDIDVADVLLTVSVLLLGPVFTLAATIPYNILTARRDQLRIVYEFASTGVMIIMASIPASLISEPLLYAEESSISTAATIYSALVVAVTLLVVNSLIAAGLFKIKYQQTFSQTWRELMGIYLVSDAVNILTSVFGVLAFIYYGPAAALIVVAGSIASQALVYRTRDRELENRRLKERILSLEESLDVANLTFGAMVIEDIGSRDGYTHLHAAATSVYAADIAREMQLDENTAQRLKTAGLLHNIGMYGAPTDLLTATGTPNSVAKRLTAEHPVLGERALASVPEFSEMASWVRWHHERPDGRGYPDRLRGPWIPLEAKILAVAQAYAATVLDQPRRPGMSFEEARRELHSGAGTQFDEVVVRALLRILDTESEGYRMADDHRFIFRALGEATPELKLPAIPDEKSGDGAENRDGV